MANPRLMGCNNENIGILITNFRNKEDKIIVSTWEKKLKNQKVVKKLQEPSDCKYNKQAEPD